jgi:hypothetical protein
VAAAFGCSLTIDKITRCSNTAASLADDLSKCDFQAFYARWPRNSPRDIEPAWIPPSILSWIDRPAIDLSLGDKILSDILRADGYI